MNNDFFSEEQGAVIVEKKLKVSGPKASKKTPIDSTSYILNFGEDTLSFENLKILLNDDLNKLKSMSVEELTFHKKWEEVQESEYLIHNSPEVKGKMWNIKNWDDEEETIREIQNIKPAVRVVQTEDDEKLWLQLRVFSHSAEFNQTPGRFRKFLVVDQITNAVLGFFALSSDVPSIDVRDKDIGWNKECKETMIIHSAIGSTIAPTQPFGYNLLGGKLIALLLTTSVVRDDWVNFYQDKSKILVGITTTSLYGGLSMYSGLHKWWKSLGLSKGDISLQPSKKVYDVLHEWIKQNDGEKYIEKMTQKEGVSGPVTSAKQRVISMIFSSYGVKQSDYVHGHQRGVYYTNFYDNTRDFLCKKITEDKLIMKPIIRGDLQSIMDWWKPKAVERYKRLKSENKIKREKEFNNQMFNMPYDMAKNMYFKEVGR